MALKLISVDVDGTLVGSDHVTIPEATVHALRKAHEQGVIIVVCSGRTLGPTKKELDLLNCVDYMIVSNGAAIYDLHTGKDIYQNYLPKDKLEKIMDVMDDFSINYEIYAASQGYIDPYTQTHYFNSGLNPEFLKEYITRFLPVENGRETVMEKNTEKINVNHIEPEDWDTFYSRISLISDIEISSGFPGNVELTQKGADKGSALAWLCTFLHIHPEEVMAFGDSNNDVTMLTFAGMSYAMENGNAQAKNAAKAITKSNDEAGIAVALQAYFTKIQEV